MLSEDIKILLSAQIVEYLLYNDVEDNRNSLSLKRLMLSMTLFACAAGFFVWAQHLVEVESGFDQLVAFLVFAIPALFVGACLCLAESARAGIISALAVFAVIVVLALIANFFVPWMK